jgi:hypothetical protein
MSSQIFNKLFYKLVLINFIGQVYLINSHNNEYNKHSAQYKYNKHSAQYKYNKHSTTITNTTEIHHPHKCRNNNGNVTHLNHHIIYHHTSYIIHHTS